MEEALSHATNTCKAPATAPARGNSWECPVHLGGTKLASLVNWLVSSLDKWLARFQPVNLFVTN